MDVKIIHECVGSTLEIFIEYKVCLDKVILNTVGITGIFFCYKIPSIFKMRGDLFFV